MQVRAISKNVRVSPSKVRLVINEIKKMQPADAVKILSFTNKAASKPIQKVIMSAIANAKNNNNLDEKSLVFREIQASNGLTFKRYRPISRGRAHSIQKKATHISVVLEGAEIKNNKAEVLKDSTLKKQDQTKGKENGTKS